MFVIFQEKLRKRVLFHGTDKEAVKSHIGAQSLPKKYGGDMELPSSPLGASLWNYVCLFNEEFEGTFLKLFFNLILDTFEFSVLIIVFL